MVREGDIERDIIGYIGNERCHQRHLDVFAIVGVAGTQDESGVGVSRAGSLIAHTVYWHTSIGRGTITGVVVVGRPACWDGPDVDKADKLEHVRRTLGVALEAWVWYEVLSHGRSGKPESYHERQDYP